MPSPDEILATLTRIANEAQLVAVVWHALLAVWLIALAVGWRPPPRGLGVLALVPILSVSVLAFRFGNVFNGVVFATLAVVLAVEASRAPAASPPPVPAWSMTLGVLLIAFAWVYPHFLHAPSWLAFLVAAPMGLIPCPTLALVIGLALIGERPQSRAWLWTLAFAGLFYAVFGVVRLGVPLDALMIMGVLGLLMQLMLTPRHGGIASEHDRVGFAP